MKPTSGARPAASAPAVQASGEPGSSSRTNANDEQRREARHQRRDEPHREQPREEVAAHRVVGQRLDEVVERRVVRRARPGARRSRGRGRCASSSSSAASSSALHGGRPLGLPTTSLKRTPSNARPSSSEKTRPAMCRVSSPVSATYCAYATCCGSSGTWNAGVTSAQTEACSEHQQRAPAAMARCGGSSASAPQHERERPEPHEREQHERRPRPEVGLAARRRARAIAARVGPPGRRAAPRASAA